MPLQKYEGIFKRGSEDERNEQLFNRQASKKIKRLEDGVKAKDEALAAKDEKIKADNIVTLKGMMAVFNVDFDTAFTASRFDPSFKEEYRRLVEEK